MLLHPMIHPVAHEFPCGRFNPIVRGWRHSSGTATLGTGGWLSLARQGLSPCKMTSSFLGALGICFKHGAHLFHNSRKFQPQYILYGIQIENSTHLNETFSRSHPIVAQKQAHKYSVCLKALYMYCDNYFCRLFALPFVSFH